MAFDKEDPRLPRPDEDMVGTYRGFKVTARRSQDGESYLVGYRSDAFRAATLDDAAERIAEIVGVKRVHVFRLWPQLKESIMSKEIVTRFDNSKCRVCKQRFPKGTPMLWTKHEGCTCKPCAANQPATPTPSEEPPMPEATPVTTTPPAPSSPSVPAASVPAGDAGAALRALLGVDQLLELAAAKAAAGTLESIRPDIEKLVQAGLERIDRPRTVRIEFPQATIEPTPGEIQHPEYQRLATWIAGGVNRIWITGEAGTGKTYAVEQIARALKRSLHIAVAKDTQYDHLGFNDANGRYVETPIYRWVKDEDPNAILLLDEVDRNQVAALQSLNALLANGIAVFPNGQFPIPSTKCVIGTANTLGDGPTLRYTGCLAQDGSVVDRFDLTLHWGLHEPTERAIALTKCPHDGTARTVDACVKVRRNLERMKSDLSWGPRRTYAVCRAVAIGEKVRDALAFAGLSRLPDADRAKAMEGT